MKDRGFEKKLITQSDDLKPQFCRGNQVNKIKSKCRPAAAHAGLLYGHLSLLYGCTHPAYEKYAACYPAWPSDIRIPT
jgi:hypothetical protein